MATKNKKEIRAANNMENKTNNKINCSSFLKDFAQIVKDMKSFDTKREWVINRGREILKTSKQAIYCIHRNDKNNASALINKNKKEIGDIKKVINNNLQLKRIMSSSLQEFVEAVCIYEFVYNKKVSALNEFSEMDIDSEDYLLGVCDFTGELSRRAVISSINKQYGEVARIKEAIEIMFGEFLKLDLRNEELRRKMDSIKWNLNKVEGLLYDITMKER